jgi:glucose/arabinose dehydrogenase
MRLSHSLALLFSLVALANPTARAQTTTDPNLQIARIITNAATRNATGIEFLGPNDMLIIEQNGDVKRWNGTTTSLIQHIPVVQNQVNRGLMGMDLHPDFSTNNYVYLYYSHSVNNQQTTWDEHRVSRFTWNGSQLVDELEIFDFPLDPTQQNGLLHHGGPIEFGPDGKLYGTTGDMNGRNRAEQNNQAQATTSSNAGGLYRINDDGSIPTDNPLVGNPNADFHQWYAYGYRNAFGIGFDPVTGNLWATDNGNDEYDEINLVEPGHNSGWLKFMGPIDRTSFTTADLVNLDSGSTYSDPEFSFFDNIGITGIEFLHNSGLGPAYDNRVLVGGVASSSLGTKLFSFELNQDRDGFVLGGNLADQVADTQAEINSLALTSNLGKVTDIEVGPDGLVYITTTDFGIYRLKHIPTPIGGVASTSIDNTRVHQFASPGFGAVTADASDDLRSPIGAAYDAAGNLFVSDVLRGTIYKVDTAGNVTTFADPSDGLNSPTGLAFDPATGNLYFADYLTSRIGRITPAGVVSLFADSTDGISGPFDIAFDGLGNIFVASLDNSRVLKFDSLGNGTLFADSSDGLFSPIGLTVSASGELYVADVITSKIYKFDALGNAALFADSSDGVVTPVGLDFDSAGNLYFADYLTSRIGRITPGGVASLYADSSDGISGVFDVALRGLGPGVTSLAVPEPSTLALLTMGMLFFASRVRRRNHAR